MANEELRRAWDAAWIGAENRSWTKGRLGRVNGDGSISIKTGRPNFVFVRLGSEGDQGVAVAYNKGVPLKPYLPVRLRFEPEKNYYVVYDVDIGANFDAFTGGSDTGGYNVGRHTHAIRSGLEYALEPLRFNPGRPFCTNALDVEIKSFRYFWAGVWDTYVNDGTTIDLTSYLPAATKWCWILVGVDPATNTLVAAKGADQTAQGDLTLALIDSITFTDYIPCAAVQATSTDTALTDIRRWEDGRGWINMHVDQINSIPDVNITAVADGNILVYDNATSKWINSAGATATVDIVKSFDVYMDAKERLSEQEIHGGINSLATGQPLDSVPTDVNVTAGIGKIVVVVNAGSDLAGDITITGTSVDRNTGAETGADTDTITVDAVTTDGSGTDSNGNATHSFTGAYISSKWFKGAIVLSTTNLTLTDVDVYQVAFEQFGDLSDITLDTLDFSALATNGSAWCNVHLYSLEVTGDKCNVTQEASVGVDAADVSANKWYRLREGLVAKALDGATDGIWVDAFLGPLANTWWEDINCKVWYTQQVAVDGNFAAGTDHGSLSGLTDDDHAQYLLLAGRSGGQVAYGGTGSGDDLTLHSTSHASQGDVIIQPSGFGYVGIGGTPVNDMHLVGKSIIAPTLFRITNPNAGSTASDGMYLAVSTAGTADIQNTQDSLTSFGNASTVLYIEAGGEIGINNATPATDFHLYKSTSAGMEMKFTNVTTGASSTDGFNVGINASEQGLLWNYEATDLLIGTNNTERMRTLSTGEVGIGTSAPVRTLHLHEASSGGNYIDFTNTTTGSAIGDGFLAGIDGSERATMRNRENTDMLFYTNDSGRLLIDSGGSIGIGSITAFNPAALVHLHADTSIAVWQLITNSTTGNTINDGLLIGLDSSEDAHIVNQEPSGELYIGVGGGTGADIAIDANGLVQLAGDSIRITNSQSPTPTGTGTQGEIAWDSGFIYVCTATNTWKKVAIA